MTFEDKYIELIKLQKDKVMAEMCMYISTLGLNYSLKIRLFITYIVFFRGKIENAKKILKDSNIKIDFDFSALETCLDIIINKAGFKFESYTEKLFLKSYNSYYVKKYNTEEENISFKNKKVENLYLSLKELIGYYYDVCLRISTVIETDEALSLALTYTEVFLKKLKELEYRNKNKYQHFVGVNLKRFIAR